MLPFGYIRILPPIGVIVRERLGAYLDDLQLLAYVHGAPPSYDRPGLVFASLA